MRGYLAIRSFVAGVSQAKNFHSTCNFGVIRLNDKILPESEQDLKFLKQITEHFWQEMAYENLVNLGSAQTKSSFINLSYKQANFLLNLA
jgi:hypothetical protein